MSLMELCRECDGTGERDWLEGGRCCHCRGAGIEPEDCPDCGGSGIEEVYGGHGTVTELACSTCKGSGIRRLSDERRNGENPQGRLPESTLPHQEHPHA